MNSITESPNWSLSAEEATLQGDAPLSNALSLDTDCTRDARASVKIASWSTFTTISIFAGSLFVSAFLLFWMQPLYAKMVLPLLGGSPSVWNTAMMFFQIVLLAGYGYAHVLNRYARFSSQLLIHGVVVATGLLFLPFSLALTHVPPAGTSPIFWLVGLLSTSVGWPFFALSASAPLLQSWFARSGHRLRQDPYFLYVASNLGSLLALLAFPVLLEPQLTLRGQAHIWTTGYTVLLCFLAATAALVLRSKSTVSDRPVAENSAAYVDWRQRSAWIALAFIPSSLLLGVTTYISTDIAAAPLLWVVPLALYLLSFVVAFARKPLFRQAWLLKAQSIGIVAVTVMAVQSLIFDFGNSVLLVAGAHLLTFFVTAILCHSELARRRPAVEGLTTFYFCLSIGGAAGGVFNALIAPMIFPAAWEYYLALVGACALRGLIPSAQKRVTARDLIYPALFGLLTVGVAWDAATAGSIGLGGRLAFFVVSALAIYGFTERPARLALGVAAVIGGAVLVQSSANVLHSERSFFGIYKVKHLEGGRQIALIHGTTLHGIEFTERRLRREPLAYYSRPGPAGQALSLAGFRHDVGVVGLGTGALACYRTPGERWTFFEIDEAVARIARDGRYFQYLPECGAVTRIALGDGRLSLATMPNRSYDLLVLDAFSSDSVPTHLLTREALALYLRKLKPQGFILINISNKYLNLAPVLGAAVAKAGVAAREETYEPTSAEQADGVFASDWVAIARTQSDLRFLASDRRWRPISATDGQPWTDDFSNVFRAIRW